MITTLGVFNTQAEAEAFIKRRKLENVIIDRDMFTGLFSVLDLN